MMETNTFREMLGFSKERFHFGSVMIFFTAIFIGNRFSNILGLINLYFLDDGTKTDLPGFFYSLILSVIRHPSIISIISSLLFAILLCVAFRFIANNLVAAIIAIFIFIPLNALVIFLIYPINPYEQVGDFDIFIREIPIILRDTFHFISLIIGVAIIFLIFKKRLPAILLGVILGNVLVVLGGNFPTGKNQFDCLRNTICSEL